jgi:UDP-N-acetylmuramoyl-L-alanyl-D-glutamate--2,6-diaminopimelate ligase
MMKLGDLLGTDAAGIGGREVPIAGLTADSRAVRPGYLFAALSGTQTDGMKFIGDAIARGCSALLTGADADVETSDSIAVIKDANPRLRLAKLAARFYGAQPETVAAVTGTNGKTSVASFLRQIWEAAGHTAGSMGTIGIAYAGREETLNHTTPDPVEVHEALARMAGRGVTHLALEASSHGLAQYRLDGVRFAAGAFTNITRDHLDYHPTFEDYLAAKLRLFSELLEPGQPAVVDLDSPGGEEAAAFARARGLRLIATGRRGDTLRLTASERDGFGQILGLTYEGRDYRVRIPLAGDFQTSNALVTAGLALGLGGAPEQVFAALESLKGAKGRLDLAGHAASGAPVFIDYAHTPDALENALRALRPYASRKLVVVFGCGGDRDRGKRPQMGAVATRCADHVIVTDDNPRSEDPASIRAAIMAAAPGADEIGDRQTAIDIAVAELGKDDVLLVAGKGHESGQIVGKTVIPFSDHEAVAIALGREKHGTGNHV